MSIKQFNVIVPMAGEGQRFQGQGYNTPKPLIKLEGIPLFKRAVDSLNELMLPIRYSFVVRQEHIDLFQIDQQIWEFYPDAHVFSVDFTTRGAVETCLYASSVLQADEPILVLDCDLEFKCRKFMDFMRREFLAPEKKRIGGALVSFLSQNARYSYAQINNHDYVLKTAEKEVISLHALAGAYYFSSADMFLKTAKDLLAITDIGKSEYYLSLLYNRILSYGYSVKLFKLDSFVSNGTPEELKREI